MHSSQAPDRVRRAVLLLLVVCGLMAALSGCNKPVPEFEARIEPSRGHVPFEATITASDIAQSYTFLLPGETITQENPVLEVVVDQLVWSATVKTEYAGVVLSDTVEPTATNAPPVIHNLTINGLRDRWSLKPGERTLLEFTVSSDSEVVDVEVWGSAYTTRYSIFIAPYDGDYHAIYMGRWYDDACIVYPMYASIPGEDLPYAPTGLEEGYPYLIGRVTNQFEFGGATDDGEEVPPQNGYIKVTAEGPLGLRTTRTFIIPIHAVNFEDTM